MDILSLGVPYGACPWGRLGTGRLVHACARCSPLIEANILWIFSNCRDAHFEITYRIGLTKNETTLELMLVATLGSPLYFDGLQLC